MEIGNMESIHIHTQSRRRTYYILFLLLPAVAFVSFLASFVYVDRTKSTEQTLAVEEVVEEKINFVRIGEVELEIEIADTAVSRARGLGGRTHLADNAGMLFDFGQENVRPPFWMKGMRIPIDIVWINDGAVVQIDANVSPPEPETPERLLDLYIPNQDIDLVLEVRAGLAAERGIEIGSEVEFLTETNGI